MRLSANTEQKKILWVHNFPRETGAGGVWMHNQHDFLKDEVDLYFVNDSRNLISIINHIFTLQKLSKQYEIAHAQYGSVVGFLTSLMKCKRILSLKGSDWYTSPSSSFVHRIRVFLGGLLTKFSINRFDTIIVMSERMKNEVLQKFPQASVLVMVDPIDLSKFKPIENIERTEIKKVLFASVNLKNPIKRFDLARESFELLQTKMPNTELVTMSNIPHEEVNMFMNGVDVLLLTSVYEGWPNVVKEILACNLPFVGTRVSDLEAIAYKTKSCFACDADPSALADALYKALNAPKENLRRHVAQFNMNDTLKELRSIYKSHIESDISG